jgi:hypothetical protein
MSNMTAADLKTLINVIVIDLGVGLTGSGLSVTWLRTTQGAWPDRDSIVTLMKIWLGIAAFGVIMYLLFKYR